jgi:hypothetical protein
VIVSKHRPTPHGVGALQVAEQEHPCADSSVHFPITTVPSAQVTSQAPAQFPGPAQGAGVGAGGVSQLAVQAQLVPFSHTPIAT